MVCLRTVILVLSFSLLPMASVLAADDGGGDGAPIDVLNDGEAAATNNIPWDILDCQFVFGTVPVPKALIEHYMPAGFRASGTGGPNGIASMGFETNICASGAGLDGPVEPMVYVSIWVPALVPTELQQVGDGGHFVNFDPVIPDAPRRSALVEGGMRAHDGAVVYEDVGGAAPDAPTVRRVSAEIDGFGEMSFEIAAGTPGLPGGGRFTQFTGLDGGDLARWHTRWLPASVFTGVGTVTVPEDSWVVDVIGTPTRTAQFSYGTWDYRDGIIEWPVAWE